MRATLDRRLTLHAPPEALAKELRERFTLTNPDHSDDPEQRSTGLAQLGPRLRYHYQAGKDLVLPPGAVGLVRWLAKRHGVRVQLSDQTRLQPEVAFTFKGELRPYQVDAVAQVTRYNCGVLSAPAGGGKTVMALAVIAQRCQPALVVCHTGVLLEQWVDRAAQFLDLDAREVGRIGGGELRMGERLTVAIINSLSDCASAVAPAVGLLCVDECHRVPALRYAQTVGRFDCRYRLGLSATPYRRDTLTPAIGWILGSGTKVDKAELVAVGAVLLAEAEQRRTGCRPDSDPSRRYQTALTELTEDFHRTKLIARDVARELAADRREIALVLSDRRAHCDALQNELAHCGVAAVVLTGELNQQQRDAALDSVDGKRVRCICATAQLIGEGWDWPRISLLFLATPLKFKGRLVQALGRVMRPAPGKRTPRVFDYVDEGAVFQAQAKARARVYEQEAVA